MPATWKRKSTCPTEARRAVARVAALLVTGVLVPSHAQALRLAQMLGESRSPATSGAPPAQPGRDSALAYEEALLEVDVNRQGINRSSVVLRRSDGMYLLALPDLQAFRLNTPSTAPHMHADTPYFPVDALAGGRAELDEATQRLVVTASPEAFESTLEAVPSGIPYKMPVPPTFGGFLNYDVTASHGGGQDTGSGIFEAGFFTPYGVLLNSALATASDGKRYNARLETIFQTDFPSRHSSLRLGDAVSQPGTWGSTLRFGGVQYGTNFATEPGFRAFPAPPLSGQAIVPSLVDIFVNNTLVATRRVDPGPFSIANVPFTTGGGTVRMVVRDIANQQQLVTVANPFYSSTTLLVPGLSEYSVEAGTVRENFGITSFDYGAAFAMGTYRRGLTETITAEAHGEAARGREAIGASVTAVHRTLGQLDATYAASNSEDGVGQLAILGLQHQAAPVSFGGQVQWNSRHFHRPIDSPVGGRLRRQETLGAGMQFGPHGGALSMGYVSQAFYDRVRQRTMTLSYSMNLAAWATLSISAAKVTGEQDSSSVGAAVTIPLGKNMNLSAQYDRTRADTGRSNEWNLSLQKMRTGDDPYSYRILARSDDIEGVAEYRGDRFEARLGLARVNGGEYAERVQVIGGIGYVGGYAFASRRIGGSFGVVKVADYPDVAVLLDNQYAGRTNAQGYFVIPELRAYDRNPIAVRDTDLPMDAVIETLKLDASPYFRSGIVIDFPVRRLRAGVLRIELDNGQPIPSGAVAQLEGQGEEFPVATGGEAYVNGFASRNRLVVQWKGQRCSIDIVYPDTRDPLPDLGAHRCQGVEP